jgi:hypothetical protein
VADLATVDEVQARIERTLSASERARVTELLGDASSMVRSVAGRPFGTTQHTVRRKLRNGRVHLGMTDITSVDAVKTISAVDVDATWDGMHKLVVGVTNAFDNELAVDVVDITLTRTVATPDWVKAIVMQMAARAFGRPMDTTGVTQETIASYSYSVGAAAAAGAVGLLPDEEARLRKAFPPLPGNAWVEGW